MDIVLGFADPISEAYREKLQKFLDSILAQGLTENRPPRIRFNGEIWKTIDGIHKLCSAFKEYHKV